MTEDLSPRMRILEAAITCIDKDGINNLTTRKIAEQAGTNIASINYYFRSKDNLMAEALSMTLRHLQHDMEALIANPEQPFLENVKDIFVYLIECGVHFPGVTLAHLYSPLVEKRLDSMGVEAMRSIFKMLEPYTAREFPDLPIETIRNALVQVLSSAIFTTLSPGFFQPLVGMDLTQPEDVRKLAGYLTRLLAQALKITQIE